MLKIIISTFLLQLEQVNVELSQHLEWPAYPGAIEYKVYVWLASEMQPDEPTAIMQHRYYYPSDPYPMTSQILWQIEYVTSAGIIPSPTWGFTTRYHLLENH